MASDKLPFQNLPAFDRESGQMNAVVETPKGSRNKYKFDPGLGLFRLNRVLPAGFAFPFDFGFIPSTLGGDGDPLDVLVLMDECAFTGCLVFSRLIGVIKAEQTERGEKERNDRLVAVAAASHEFRQVQALSQVNPPLVDEIEHFFISYAPMEGKEFQPLGRFGPDRARELVDEAIRQHKGAKSGSKSSGKRS